MPDVRKISDCLLGVWYVVVTRHYHAQAIGEVTNVEAPARQCLYMTNVQRHTAYNRDQDCSISVV